MEKLSNEKKSEVVGGWSILKQESPNFQEPLTLSYSKIFNILVTYKKT